MKSTREELQVTDSTIKVPDKVKELVERFERHIHEYKSTKYNEAQLREEFINPFFKALGWDIYNEQGFAPAYRDVIHEDSIKVGGGTKAPDYCFTLSGKKMFFVEVKKPTVHIKTDVHPAFQLRRYAWSAKLPLSILTDFEEFAVYESRKRPKKDDKASVERVLYFTYKDFIGRWGEIQSIFSKKAVQQGSFDRYVESAKKKRGTAEVDDEFLNEIEGWRDKLARNIAVRNLKLSVEAINYAVQMTIDRIIFLRISEDRGLEPYGQIRNVLKEENIYSALFGLFKKADKKYNSGLFHFEEETKRGTRIDTLTPTLTIDNKVLKDIIKKLYFPDCPYEFSMISSEILGNIYEQFLGKIIRLTPEHHAKIEEKPEVKKAGGIYYTPKYIVDYIVKKTVGRFCKGKRLKGVAKLRILDPACGSGTFLLGAFSYLLDWHLNHYTKSRKKDKLTDKIYKDRDGQWHLTIREKKRILLDHIYGVDKDSQAVEVTKLSLLLKVLEGESQEVLLTQQKKLTQWTGPERALPDLGSNIKCGNSLIDEHFIRTQLMTDCEDISTINPFEWKTEFPDIMSSGGFDVVIGNPPYVRIQAMKEWAPMEVEYYQRRYISASTGNIDIYVVFVERALSLLNKNGMMGFILPHKFFQAKYGLPLRQFIAEGRHLAEIVHFGDQQVFDRATTYTCLLFLDNEGNQRFRYIKAHDLDAWRTNGKAEEDEIKADIVNEKEWNFTIGPSADLFLRLSEVQTTLGDVARIFQGLVTGSDKIFVLEGKESQDTPLVGVKDKDGVEWNLERELLKPFICNIAVSSFSLPESKNWIIFPYHLYEKNAQLITAQEMADSYPRVWDYLRSKNHILRNREGGKWNHEKWYAFGRTQNLIQMDDPKLIVQVISQTGKYSYDSKGIYFTGGGNGPYYGIRWLDDDNQHSLHYLQGLLNSRLLDFYLHCISSPFRGGYWSYGKRFIEKLPIRTLDFSKPNERDLHNRMVTLVERMFMLHRDIARVGSPEKKQAVQRVIDITEQEINTLVYDLYGLTKKEIELVEGATKK